MVRAINSVGESANSTQVATIPLAAPGGLTGTWANGANGANGTVSLLWTAVPSAGGYRIYRHLDGSSFDYSTPLGTTSSTNYTNAGLTNNTNYTYEVRAYNTASQSASSAAITRKPLSPPSGLVSTWTGTTANLSWGAVTDATSYKLFVTQTSNDYSNATITTPSSNSASISGLTPGTPTYFMVHALNASGETTNSSQQSVTALGAPTSFTLTWTTGRAILGWSAVTGASGYDVFRHDTSGGFNYSSPLVSTTSSLAYTNNGLTNDSTYTYVVRAKNTGSSSVDSAPASVTPRAAPIVRVTSIGSGTGTLAWNQVPGATGYKVFRRAAGASFDYTSFVSTPNASYSATGLTDGPPTFFVVRALNSSGETIDSNLASITSVAAPAGVTASPGNAQVTLSWGTVTGATGYFVESATSSSGPFQSAGTTTGGSATSLPVTGLTNGTAYFFRVSASNAGGTGPASAVLSATPLAPPAPPVIQAQVGDAKVLISWDAVAGATSYQVFRTTTFNDPNPALITTVNAPTVSFMDNGAQNGTTYYYSVKALNAGGASAASNSVVAALSQDGGSAPIVVTGTPLSLSTFPGTSRTVTMRYRDVDGSSNLVCGWVMVNDRVSWEDGLCVVYDATANLLYLRDDLGQNWLGGFAPGSANTISNSQGTIDCAQTTVTRTDTDLVISFFLTPKSGLVGNNHIYGYTSDPQGNESGFVDVGAWNVNPTSAPQLIVPAPSIALSTLANQDQTVSMGCRDGDGTAALGSEWIIIGKTSDWSNSITAVYYRPQNVLYLRSDDGSGWLGGFAPGSANTISNSQGTIDCASTSVTLQGNDLTVNWHITPRAGSLGANTIWAYCDDQAGQHSPFPFTAIGTWTVGLPAPLNLAAQATGPNSIALSWDAVAGATGYQLFRAGSDGAFDTSAPLATISTAAQTTYPDAGLSSDTSYTYVVRATSAAGSSASSTPATAHTTALPTLTMAPASVQEGDAGLTSLVFTAQLSAPAPQNVTLSYTTGGGSATAGSDYVQSSGTLTIAAGARTATITVPVYGDTLVEPDEILQLTLSDIVGARLDTGTTLAATGTITNDDNPPPTSQPITPQPVTPTPLPLLSVAGPSGSVSVNEGNAGLMSLSFPVHLLPASTSDVTFTYTTVAGTATAGEDYVEASGTFTIPAGQTDKSVNISVHGDTVVEPDETLQLQIADITGARLASGTSLSVTGTIVNDDALPPTPTPVSPPGTLAAPVLTATTGFTGTPSNVWVRLSWDPVPGATGYSIKRASTYNGQYEIIATGVTDTNYTDGGRSNNVNYFYMVSATDAQGQESDNSNIVDAFANFNIDARINNGQGTPWVGQNIINDTAQDQEVLQRTPAGTTATYFVSVHRTGMYDAVHPNDSNGITFTVPGFAAFTQAGGLAHFFVGTTSQDITSAITSANGWGTLLVSSQDAVVRLEITVPAGTEDGVIQSLKVKVRDYSLGEVPPTDVVSAVVMVDSSSPGTPPDTVTPPTDPQKQHIIGIKWSYDGETWHPVTNASVIQIQRHATLGFQAILSDGIPWDEHPIGPLWTGLENDVEGTEVWLTPSQLAYASGRTVTATLDNTVTAQVRVLPDAHAEFDIGDSQALLTPGQSQTSSIPVTVHVSDEDDQPLSGVRVRLRATPSNSSLLNQWEGGSQDQTVILTTGNDGTAHINWAGQLSDILQSTTLKSSVKLEVEVIDSLDEAFGSKDDFTLQVLPDPNAQFLAP